MSDVSMTRHLRALRLLKRKGGHGPDGVLKSVDIDMPTPVMRSQEEEHVHEGVMKSVDTDGERERSRR